MPWIYSNKILVAFPFMTKLWFLSTKSFDSSFNDRFIFSWCCNLYCWLPWFQHLKICIFILAQLILDKLERFMIIITFGNTVLDATIMHPIISCHSSVHGVASWSGICRLTNRYAFECNIVGCLRLPLNYLVATGTVGLLFLISVVVVFSHMTMMPRRNLDSRVRCSHMIELLGARWWRNSLQSPSNQPY